MVLAEAGRGDLILCQVTGNAYADPLAIELGSSDFLEGSLQRISYARPGKLFTANANLIIRHADRLTPASFDRVRQQVIEILRGLSTP